MQETTGPETPDWLKNAALAAQQQEAALNVANSADVGDQPAAATSKEPETSVTDDPDESPAESEGAGANPPPVQEDSDTLENVDNQTNDDDHSLPQVNSEAIANATSLEVLQQLENQLLAEQKTLQREQQNLLDQPRSPESRKRLGEIAQRLNIEIYDLLDEVDAKRAELAQVEESSATTEEEQAPTLSERVRQWALDIYAEQLGRGDVTPEARASAEVIAALVVNFDRNMGQLYDVIKRQNEVIAGLQRDLDQLKNNPDSVGSSPDEVLPEPEPSVDPLPAPLTQPAATPRPIPTPPSGESHAAAAATEPPSAPTDKEAPTDKDSNHETHAEDQKKKVDLPKMGTQLGEKVGGIISKIRRQKAVDAEERLNQRNQETVTIAPQLVSLFSGENLRFDSQMLSAVHSIREKAARGENLTPAQRSLVETADDWAEALVNRNDPEVIDNLVQSQRIFEPRLNATVAEIKRLSENDPAKEAAIVSRVVELLQPIPVTPPPADSDPETPTTT